MVVFNSRCDCCGRAARGLCASCRGALEPPVLPDLKPEIERVVALFSYTDIGASLLQNLKFHNRRRSLPELVDASLAVLDVPTDLVVPVPADSARLRARGYDLPALIARRVSRRLVVRTTDPLVRRDPGSQRGRTRSERILAASYECVRRVDGAVLLIDDVVTTGSTARACASALYRAGATSVSLLVLGVTPPTSATVSLCTDQAASQ